MSVSNLAFGSSAVAGFKFQTNTWNTTAIASAGVALIAGDGFEILVGGGWPKTTDVYAENDAAPGGVAIRKKRIRRTSTTEGSFQMN